MNKEFVMRYMVEFGLDAEVSPITLYKLGLMKSASMNYEDKQTLHNLTKDGWLSYDPITFKITLTKKSKDLLKVDSGG